MLRAQRSHAGPRQKLQSLTWQHESDILRPKYRGWVDGFLRRVLLYWKGGIFWLFKYHSGLSFSCLFSLLVSIYLAIPFSLIFNFFPLSVSRLVPLILCSLPILTSVSPVPSNVTDMTDFLNWLDAPMYRAGLFQVLVGQVKSCEGK